MSRISADTITSREGGPPTLSQGVVVSAAGTFSSSVNIDATTESTSSITGALVVDGGVGIAKSLNVAGRTNVGGKVQFTVASPQLEFNNGGPRLWSPSANTLTIHTGGGFGSTSNERLRIGSAGQFGIGGANYGTAGQVLSSQGASAAPQWATPAAGGMVPLLSTNPTTGTEIFATTNLLNSTYKHYRLEYYYEGDSAELRLQQYVGSGYQTTNTYDYRYLVYNSNGTSITSADSNKSYMPVSSEQTRPTWQGTIDFYNPTSTTKQTTFVANSDGWQLQIPWTVQNGNNLGAKCVCAADADGTVVAVTGLKLYSSTTNIYHAYATLYGMKTA